MFWSAAIHRRFPWKCLERQSMSPPQESGDELPHSKTKDCGDESQHTGPDAPAEAGCPLSVRQQNRNLLRYAFHMSLIYLAAAVFAAWQALTAHWARLADNEGTVVEWSPAEWIGADVVVIRSNGPAMAWRVWARLTVEGRAAVQRAHRLTPGDALRFEISGQ